ncbi:hypothetical protein E2C01_032684 [Portunus trituberculatus]|uniref:Uncharacterized protein n=1 Tax=Portunus trituberculatus TaxID=210409 RepID=A0A5B7EWL0_PORTR|nr:hypothetical protein [Portunus trituberculatus]
MDKDSVLETPRRSLLSSASKQSSCKKVLPVGEDERKRDRQKLNNSHDIKTPLPSADHSTWDAQLDCLSIVISDLIAKLDGNLPATTASVRSGADFSGFAAALCGDEEGEIHEGACDPLEELDLFGVPQPAHPDAEGDNADFLRALEELSGHFQGEEEKGESLSERLATILYASLRCRLSSDGVKSTCSKIKLSSNVSKLSVLATNSAMTVGDKLIDMRLFRTNELLSKTIVPVAQYISDIDNFVRGNIFAARRLW